MTGNAASLKFDGTLDGANLGYQANTALDLNSAYSVTIPDLAFDRAQVKAQTNATFVKLGSVEINAITATTTYADRTLQFQTHVAQGRAGGQAEAAAGGDSSGTRELDATGSVILHPDHQEVHLPSLSLRTQGVEWKSAPGAQATVKYGQDRIEVQDVRLVNADQVLNVDGVFAIGENVRFDGIKVHAENVDVAQLEKLALQNRGLTGRLNADATISGSANAPTVTGHAPTTAVTLG